MSKEKISKETDVQEPPLNAKEEAVEFFKTAVIAVFLALVIRTFLFEPFNIPSGSMKPTLLVGDYLFVDKPAYGYSRHSFPFGLAPIEGRVWDDPPQRGDVVVFKLPKNPGQDYVKRLIGLPGDTVQMRSGHLYINGEKAKREAVGLKNDQIKYQGKVVSESSVVEYTQTLPGGATFQIFEQSDEELFDNTPPFVVPKGHYFMMGDNRDNSADSRADVGFVPFENFVGRANFLFFSTNGHARIYEIWKWPWSIRYDRFFDGLNPERPEDIDGNEE